MILTYAHELYPGTSDLYFNVTADFETEILRGAALLDEVVPGWADAIDASQLDLNNVNSCVLGQLAVSDLLSPAIVAKFDDTNPGLFDDSQRDYWSLGRVLNNLGKLDNPHGLGVDDLLAWYGFNIADLTNIKDNQRAQAAFEFSQESAEDYLYFYHKYQFPDFFDYLTDQWKDLIALRKSVTRQKPRALSTNLIDNLPTQPRSLV